jgi:hypothetical protein
MTGNSVKLGIAAVSIAYDIILMVKRCVMLVCNVMMATLQTQMWKINGRLLLLQVQHYIVYPEGAAALLPQQREGFKPVPADDDDSLPVFADRQPRPTATDQ